MGANAPRVKQVKVHGELQDETTAHSADTVGSPDSTQRAEDQVPKPAAARREGMPADDRLQKRNDSLVRLSDSDDPRAPGSP